MAIRVKSMSDALGAEISGVDLTQPLDVKTASDIYTAWLDHLVIVFRDQKITDEDQIRFADYFGKVGAYHRPKKMQHGNHASSTVMLISNIRENGEPIGAHPDGEMMFHTDTAYHENPHKATTLYGVEVPSTGGYTLFSNQYKVYDALSDELKQRLKGRQAMNVYEFGTTIKTKARYDRKKVPHHAHPIFRKHPETGRTSLYVGELMTEEIIGLPKVESDRILAELYAMQKRPEFIYAHHWRVGDLVMWDNRCLVHARTDFPFSERRHLRRVTIGDETAVLAA
jgi:taurine dioxygenase